MKKAFVISDVHLSSMASPTGEAMLFLVRKAQSECDLFIILGDLFDLWLGEGEYFKKQYETLIAELKKLKKTCRIVYFEGNHDLHLKKFWEDELGFEVFVSPQLLEYKGLRIWAEHGDEINREDRDYLFLRWFLRTPPIKFIIYNLPSKISNLIGKKASSVSRQYTEKLENKSIEIFRQYAQTLIQTKDFDLLLVGHTHITDDFTFEYRGRLRRLINLGSWYSEPHYLEIASSKDIKIINF